MVQMGYIQIAEKEFERFKIELLFQCQLIEEPVTWD